MSREWKPGDVAMVTLRDGSEPRQMTRYETNFERGWFGGKGMNKEGCAHYSDDMSAKGADVRRLVVIDPDDREQVQHLIGLYDAYGGQLEQRTFLGVMTNPVDSMTLALREFADPKPRIEEPMGLGAVVEDAEGRRFTLCCDCGCDKRWRVTQAIDGTPGHCWPDINAVRVLSEGIS